MKNLKFYIDEKGGNLARIESGLKVYPYKGAKKKQNAVRLSLYAIYDDNFLYNISLHESMEEAINKMNKCGEWKEV